MPRGFEKAPNDLTFDAALSIGARAIFPALLHMAWEAGRREDEDAAELPSQEEIARRFGCSKTALKGYLRELREAGWIVVVRRGRARPQRYWIRTSLDGEFYPIMDGADSAPSKAADGADSAPSSEVMPPIRDKDQSEAIASSPGRPPALVKVDGQDLALNALMVECEIDPKSPRLKQAVVAMNGQRGQPGIRELFWIEAERWAADHPEERHRFALGEQPRFEVMLATQVRRKAQRYREQMPGAFLTPTALRSHWLDLELRTARRDGGLTGDEIRRMFA